MAHSVGGMFDSPHGECNSLLIDHVIRFNWSHAGHRYGELADIFGLSLEGLSSREACDAIANTVSRFKKRVGITNTLNSYGIQDKDIPHLARMAVNDPCMATNPVPPTISDIEAIYAQAL